MTSSNKHHQLIPKVPPNWVLLSGGFIKLAQGGLARGTRSMVRPIIYQYPIVSDTSDMSVMIVRGVLRDDDAGVKNKPLIII